MNDPESVELLKRYRDGDEQAASEIFDRYVVRLMGLARNRLSAKLARRIDPEDVVQSAYRSFFRAAGEGGFEIQNNGDLWRLLVAITLNKLRMQARRHRADKRSMACEESMIQRSGTFGLPPEDVAAEPLPEEAAAVAEQLERLMHDLDERQRQALQLRLQGYMIEEIAEEIGCSERTVRRWMDQIKDQLQRDLDATQSGS